MFPEINLAHQGFPYIADDRDALPSKYQWEKQVHVYASKISARHLKILVAIAEMAERGELVNDLAHSAVMSCFIAMHKVGAEPPEVREIFGGAIKDSLEKISPERERYRDVLEGAYAQLAVMSVRERLLSNERFR